MWHPFPPWLDKFSAISVYMRKTLGPLGPFNSSKFNFTDGTDSRNDSSSRIHLNLWDTEARVVASGRVSRVSMAGVSSLRVSKAGVSSLRVSKAGDSLAGYTKAGDSLAGYTKAGATETLRPVPLRH